MESEKTKMPILSWFGSMSITPKNREGGRTVGSGRVASIIE